MEVVFIIYIYIYLIYYAMGIMDEWVIFSHAKKEKC